MQLVRPRWSPRTKLTVTLLLLALTVYLLYRFNAVLKPLILAIVLAYVLSPLANWLQTRLKIRRGLATITAYMIMIATVSMIPLIIIPPLSDQFANLNLNIQQLIEEIDTLLGYKVFIAGQSFQLNVIFEQAIGSIQQLIEPVFGQTLSFAIEAISSLVWVIFILVVSFYLVKDAANLQKWFLEIVPPSYINDFIHLRSEVHQIWSAFFRGQLLLMLLVASIFTVVGLLIGIPFALTMGIIAGLLEFLPSVGHGIWLATATLLALFAGSTWLQIPNWAFALIIIGLHIFFQQFDLNYLIPRIIGRQVHLPPLVVILGIVSGALLAGVLGILLAAPTIASARVVGRYIYANLFDQDPFPTPMAAPLPPPDPNWWKKTLPTQKSNPNDTLNKL